MKLVKKTTSICLAVLVSFSLAANFTACSQTASEHPEHPEHPEKETTKHLTVAELSYAVNKYVKEESAKNDGYFIVKDKAGDLKLKLKKIHDDRLTSLSHTLHFVCADFTAAGSGTADAVVYDIDIFMEGTDKDNLKTTEVKVHKKNGKARYAWYEEDGVWKTRDATVAPAPEKKKAEHPEHPKN